MVKDPYKYFRVEARDLLEQLGQGALDLEKGGAASALVPRLLRLAHTLKGAARVVKQPEIADQAHAVEDALAPWREGAEAVPRQAIDAVLACLDRMSARVAALTPSAEPAAPVHAAATLPEEALRTVRADVGEMDALLDGVAQTHAQIAGLRRRFDALERARTLAARLQEQLALRSGAAPGRLANGQRKTLALADELRAALGGCTQGLGLSMDRLDRELRQLRDAAEQLRLVAAGALFTMLERSARDAAQTLGKQVLFEGRGGDVRLDAPVLGTVQAALLQLVRNAVAHGIEMPRERELAGKPAQGRITLEVLPHGRRVVFRCSDDGAGVDIEAVWRSARRKGLPAAGDGQDAEAVLRLLLRGGISTSGAVTEVSGRGIGLDVVREAVERLGGDVAVHTRAGQGTTLELTVPVSLASVDALLLEAAGAVVALPVDAVRGTMRLATAQIASTAQGQSIVHQGRAVPYLALANALGRPADTFSARQVSVVIVEGAGALVAIGVERLVATAKLVLRPLPELVPPTPLVAGTFFDVEGNPQLVLDPDGLVRYAQRAEQPAAPVEVHRAPVLVVDDSLTTRMLEQSILESAGYEVHAAVSAEDALEQARRNPYALFLVDVEMPGMDGFTFIERTRADPALRHVPALLVTSRNSPEDRRRGEDVGAQGYIVKSEFAQTEFLDRVRQLVQAAA